MKETQAFPEHKVYSTQNVDFEVDYTITERYIKPLLIPWIREISLNYAIEINK